MNSASDRAVSPILGFVLVMAIVIAGFTMWQTEFVPNHNEAIEYQHNQRVQGDLRELASAITRTALLGSNQPVTIELSPSYPEGTVRVNPPPPQGRISTETTNSTITITNAVPRNPYVETFWNEHFTGNPEYETRTIRYNPNYNLYQNAPETVYENTVLYNQFNESDLPLTQQIIYSDAGNRLTIISIEGTLTESGTGSTTLNLKPISSIQNTITITGEDGNDIELRFPTELAEEQWIELLEPESTTEILNVEVIDDELVITLDGSQVYELRSAQIGIGNPDEEPEEEYLVYPKNDSTVNAGEEIAFEVRDEYNNPLTGVEVSTNSSETECDGLTDTTDQHGEVEFVCDAPETEFTVFIGSPGNIPGESYKQVVIETGEPEGAISGRGAGVIISDVTYESSGGARGWNLTFSITAENVDPDSKNITRAQVAFLSQTESDGELEFTSQPSNPLVIGGPYQELDPELGTDDETHRLRIDDNQPDAFLILNVVFADGSSSTYFIVD